MEGHLMEIDRRLKWLENRLAKLAEINTERSISVNAKTKEAKELLSKVFEIQALIDQEDDLTSQYVHQQSFDELEAVRREIISPYQNFSSEKQMC